MFSLLPPCPGSTLFPYTTLFRSIVLHVEQPARQIVHHRPVLQGPVVEPAAHHRPRVRSQEHTSEVQSHTDLVCRLPVEKKNLPHRAAYRSPLPRNTSQGVVELGR